MNSRLNAVRKAGLICAALLVSTLACLADPTGEWMVERDLARIAVINCDNRMWGIVAWEKEAALDVNNPDPAKRTRPTLGMPVLLDMKPVAPNRWEGQVYNSNDGKTYSASISLINPDTLRVQGCLLGFLCGGETWKRVTAPILSRALCAQVRN